VVSKITSKDGTEGAILSGNQTQMLRFSSRVRPKQRAKQIANGQIRNIVEQEFKDN